MPDFFRITDISNSLIYKCNNSSSFEKNYICLYVRIYSAVLGEQMIQLKAFEQFGDVELNNFKPKPTTKTPGQVEASCILWSSEDGKTKIGIWECSEGTFTADRTSAAEFCHILYGRASVINHDVNGQRELSGGDLLVLPKGWKGEWTIHEKVKKLFIIQV